MFAKRPVGLPQGWLVAGVLLGASFSFVTPVFAVGQSCNGSGDCKIPVKFTGVYLENTCQVSIDGKGSNAIVGLPRIPASELQVDGSEAGSTQFDISLSACPPNTNINLSFVSVGIDPDLTTGNLMNSTGLGMSQGVQVRLRSVPNNQLRINDSSTFQQYAIPADGREVTQYYIASYYAKGAGTVTPGLVNTLAGIELRYN
ncbi:fimbrial protein [Serratia sp. UGAL515B_01]|uniref:fimbrial protein n=1 Tax=Serratia sp. UGAL515B_01 TaxID=2986763 RepID=UPI00295513F8|nr:fimbrial protein [Serratia sp. UGAL515B_01]WON77482.1 type 1 fimbrial protein [Serratia sp. UGAL515B_01]